MTNKITEMVKQQLDEKGILKQVGGTLKNIAVETGKGIADVFKEPPKAKDIADIAKYTAKKAMTGQLIKNHESVELDEASMPFSAVIGQNEFDRFKKNRVSTHEFNTFVHHPSKDQITTVYKNGSHIGTMNHKTGTYASVNPYKVNESVELDEATDAAYKKANDEAQAASEKANNSGKVEDHKEARRAQNSAARLSPTDDKYKIHRIRAKGHEEEIVSQGGKVYESEELDEAVSPQSAHNVVTLAGAKPGDSYFEHDDDTRKQIVSYGKRNGIKHNTSSRASGKGLNRHIWDTMMSKALKHKPTIKNESEELDEASKTHSRQTPYGLRHTEFKGKEGRLTHVETWHTSPEAREKYVNKVQEKDGFHDITGYHDPQSNESVEIDEALGARDKLKKLQSQLSHYSDKAVEANRNGDDEMVIAHQKKMSQIKSQMNKIAKNESVEIDEAKKSKASSIIKDKLSLMQFLKTGAAAKNKPEPTTPQKTAESVELDEWEGGKTGYKANTPVTGRQVKGTYGTSDDEFDTTTPTTSKKFSTDALTAALGLKAKPVSGAVQTHSVDKVAGDKPAYISSAEDAVNSAKTTGEKEKANKALKSFQKIHQVFKSGGVEGLKAMHSANTGNANVQARIQSAIEHHSNNK